MKHLGDITKINGVEIEPVDVITFGSPCQDLSVAGKRKGLDGERSGLFMEAIRIIREMRKKTNGLFPIVAIWENVPGAFSSNAKEDFRAVIEELVRCSAPANTVIPRPPKGWQSAGCILGDGWSLAWRVYDARFWGVPQRRSRIALVMDFRGESAPEILFEREGVSGDSSPGEKPWEKFTQRTSDCPCRASAGFAGQAAGNTSLAYGAEISPTITQSQECSVLIDYYPQKSEANISDSGICQTLTAKMGTGGGNVPLLMETAYCIQGNSIDRADTTGCNGAGWSEGVCYTLNTVDRPAVYAICSDSSNSMKSDNPNSGIYRTEVSRTLDCNGGTPCCNQGGIMVVDNPDSSMTFDCRNMMINGDLSGTLQAKESGGFSINYINPVITKKRVRRLTPLECERLQGYPDGWTDIPLWMDSTGKIRKLTDSRRYKALGNSIALPNWHWILSRCSGEKLGSLFDGIGGFPLCWEMLHGKGSARWASEIEEFPVAVTKHWFGEE